jgi:hypothetical protein
LDLKRRSAHPRGDGGWALWFAMRKLRIQGLIENILQFAFPIYMGSQVTHMEKTMADQMQAIKVYPIKSRACNLTPAAITGKKARVQNGWIILVQASP